MSQVESLLQRKLTLREFIYPQEAQSTQLKKFNAPGRRKAAKQSRHSTRGSQGPRPKENSKEIKVLDAGKCSVQHRNKAAKKSKYLTREVRASGTHESSNRKAPAIRGGISSPAELMSPYFALPRRTPKEMQNQHRPYPLSQAPSMSSLGPTLTLSGRSSISTPVIFLLVQLLCSLPGGFSFFGLFSQSIPGFFGVRLLLVSSFLI